MPHDGIQLQGPAGHDVSDSGPPSGVHLPELAGPSGRPNAVPSVVRPFWLSHGSAGFSVGDEEVGRLKADQAHDTSSPFIGRLDDIGNEGMQVVRDIVDIFKVQNIKTQVLVSSIRHPIHVIEAAKTGAQVATMPFNVLEKMIQHSLTDKGLKQFLDDWEKVKKLSAKMIYEKQV